MKSTEHTETRAKELVPYLPEVAPFQKLTLSVKAAAEATGLSRSGLYKAMTERKLKFIKVGTRRLIEIEALKEFLYGGQQ